MSYLLSSFSSYIWFDKKIVKHPLFLANKQGKKNHDVAHQHLKLANRKCMEPICLVKMSVDGFQNTKTECIAK